MNKRLYPFLAIILTQFLIGCFGVSSTRYSKPTLDGNTVLPVKYEKYVGEMFVTPDIAFHVYPLNSTDSGVALFPIPFPYGEGQTRLDKSSVSVSLRPSKPGFTFSPQEVLFWRVDTDPQAPVTVIGPRECASSSPRPPQQTLPIEPILLKDNVAFCFWLDISVAPPDPADIFFVQIKGLNFKGSPYSLPIIKFQEDKRNEIFALP